ncbi:alpha/beta hydrolase [Microbacterium sp. P02]|uniref:alpha/beta hydrolase n=1 Tax=Microbacterium sp. P02 TaxID=3366260 RepID=UPI003671CEF7
MTGWLLSLELLDSPVLALTAAATALLLLIVVLPRPRHPWRFVFGAGAGAVLAFATLAVVDVTQAIGDNVLPAAGAWVSVGFAAVGLSVAGVLTRPWWRRLVALAAAALALCATVVGVNFAYGIDHNLSAILGVQSAPAVTLPALTTDDADQTLFSSWKPPAGMPQQGMVGALSGANAIPSPGYAAREPAIYLPPAALVENPPKLPLLVFMMGQPGSPDPTSLAIALDDYAAAHQGLAPIAIVADQLTDPERDPACRDSAAYGAVSTYFNTQIPAFALAKLNIDPDPATWTIGGYSNGGSCAITWAAQHPHIWGNVIDVSGNEFPGSETGAETTAAVFGGDTAAFEASKPANVMAAAPPGAYRGHTAVFTAGSDDEEFGPGQERNARAARDAGFTVTFEKIPGAGHTGEALDQGLALSLDAMGKAWGLAPP